MLGQWVRLFIALCAHRLVFYFYKILPGSLEIVDRMMVTKVTSSPTSRCSWMVCDCDHRHFIIQEVIQRALTMLFADHWTTVANEEWPYNKWSCASRPPWGEERLWRAGCCGQSWGMLLEEDLPIIPLPLRANTAVHSRHPFWMFLGCHPPTQPASQVRGAGRLQRLPAAVLCSSKNAGQAQDQNEILP